jgi:hypothetical protein
MTRLDEAATDRLRHNADEAMDMTDFAEGTVQLARMLAEAL